jgi:hypothetical protein
MATARPHDPRRAFPNMRRNGQFDGFGEPVIEPDPLALPADACARSLVNLLAFFHDEGRGASS